MKDGRHDGSPVKRLCGRLIGVALLLGLFAMGQQASAFAQAGSTGGTIGKQNKSASGNDDAAISRRAAPAKTTAPAGGPCSRIVGTWLWHNGVSVTVHADSNRTTQSDGNSASIVCAGGTYSFTWFGIHTARETLSSDGKRLSGDETAVRQ